MDTEQKSTSNQTDNKTEAWQSFVEGNEASFETVFKAYFKSMYGYGLKLCDKPELVEDCIQELFQNIWERRAQLTHVNSPNVYLFVSLRRKILKKLKAEKTSSNDLDEAEGKTAVRFCQEELIIKDEVKFQKKQELKEALNQLSNRQKEIVYLHFYNGMSYGEIESILSINRQSVRNHMYRAMQTLRSLLDTEIMKLVVSLLLMVLFVG